MCLIPERVTRAKTGTVVHSQNGAAAPRACATSWLKYSSGKTDVLLLTSRIVKLMPRITALAVIFRSPAARGRTLFFFPRVLRQFRFRGNREHHILNERNPRGRNNLFDRRAKDFYGAGGGGG